MDELPTPCCSGLHRSCTPDCNRGTDPVCQIDLRCIDVCTCKIDSCANRPDSEEEELEDVNDEIGDMTDSDVAADVNVLINVSHCGTYLSGFIVFD